MPKSVLLHHPDASVEQEISRTLEKLGATIAFAVDFDEVLARIAASTHDVVVIDTVLAGERLETIIEALRHATTSKPVVIVTSTSGEVLDPTVVSLVVPTGYDISMLVGVILACVTESSATPPLESPRPQLQF